MTSDGFDLNPNSPWGRSLTEAERGRMFSTGRLDGSALERFWRMNDFQAPMPAYLDLMVNTRDIKKLIRK